MERVKRALNEIKGVVIRYHYIAKTAAPITIEEVYYESCDIIARYIPTLKSVSEEELIEVAGDKFKLPISEGYVFRPNWWLERYVA